MKRSSSHKKDQLTCVQDKVHRFSEYFQNKSCSEFFKILFKKHLFVSCSDTTEHTFNRIGSRKNEIHTFTKKYISTFYSAISRYINQVHYCSQNKNYLKSKSGEGEGEGAGVGSRGMKLNHICQAIGACQNIPQFHPNLCCQTYGTDTVHKFMNPVYSALLHIFY